MEHKYKLGDKVWKAELYDSFQSEIIEVLEISGKPFYHISIGNGWTTIGEHLLFDTKEECEKYRIETFKAFLDNNGKFDEAKLQAQALRPPKPPIPDDGKVRVVYNKDYGGFGLSYEAIEWLKEHGLEFKYASDIPRHNKLLVQCVHELGRKASGEHSHLDIYELSGNRYRIEEYDGKEWVDEPEDEDWIEVR